VVNFLDSFNVGLSILLFVGLLANCWLAFKLLKARLDKSDHELKLMTEIINDVARTPGGMAVLEQLMQNSEKGS